MLEAIHRNIQNLATLRSVKFTRLIWKILRLLPEYYFGTGRSSSPLNITLEITYRCNLRCSFCFLKNNVLNRKNKEMELSELVPLLEDAERMGAGFYITGGEPLLRPDLGDIVRDIKMRRLKCGINSNGVLLDRKKGKELVGAGLDYLIVSLPGPREIYRRVVGREGVFDRVVENLRNFAEIKGNCRLLINGVVLPGEPESLHKVVEIGRETGVNGITFQHLQYLTPYDVNLQNRIWSQFFEEPQALIYGEKDFIGPDIEALDREIQSIVDMEPSTDLKIYFKPNINREGLGNWYGERFRRSHRCVYPWTDTRVAPNGDVYPCQFIPLPIGNLKNDRLGVLFNNSKYRAFRRAIRNAGGSFPACARCCKLYRTINLRGGRRRTRKG